MIASHICKDLYEMILGEEKQGTIHSIFKNSINIIGKDHRFISVIGPNKPISPNGIKLRDEINFSDRNINIGEKGRFTKTNFTSKHLNIYYGDCILWDGKINIPYKKDNLENLLYKLEHLGRFILHHGNKNGIFILLQCLQEEFNYGNRILDKNYILGKRELFIKDRFLEFIRSFRDLKLEEINLKSKKIIGFGNGLTPSMDDFLCGMMISNIYISHFLGMNIENTYKINQDIIKDIGNRTTLVSEEMLKSSAIGECNEDIRSLMVGLIGTNTIEKIYGLSEKVANLGYSSGSDILCGIYIGSTILLNKIKGEYTWE